MEGPLWPFKHTSAQLAIRKAGDKFTYGAQLQQDPTAALGNMFKDSFWKHYDMLPSGVDTVRIYGDTAQKVKERNDFSVFQVWARVPPLGIFLIDQVRGKWEAPMLESATVEFWNKHKPTIYQPMGASALYIEDKSSGSSLIQSLQTNYMIPVIPIQRHTDKVFRAYGIINYIASGFVHLPLNVDWMNDYKEEFRRFTPMMTHRHDDQIDPTMDAIQDLLVSDQVLYSEASMS